MSFLHHFPALHSPSSAHALTPLSREDSKHSTGDVAPFIMDLGISRAGGGGGGEDFSPLSINRESRCSRHLKEAITPRSDPPDLGQNLTELMSWRNTAVGKGRGRKCCCRMLSAIHGLCACGRSCVGSLHPGKATSICCLPCVPGAIFPGTGSPSGWFCTAHLWDGGIFPRSALPLWILGPSAPGWGGCAGGCSKCGALALAQPGLLFFMAQSQLAPRAGGRELPYLHGGQDRDEFMRLYIT